MGGQSTLAALLSTQTSTWCREGFVKFAVSPRASTTLSRPASLMSATLCGYVVAYIGVWAAVHGPARQTAIDLLNVVAPLFAAILCAWAIRSVRVLSLRRFWSVVAAAMFVSALAEATWTFYELARGINAPFPSIADLFRLLSYPLLFVAIVELISLGRKGRLATVGVALEGLIVALAAVLIVWQFVMLPSIDPNASVLANLVSVAYPGGDVLLLAALTSLVLLPTRGALPSGLPLIAGAFVVNIIGDLAYSVAENRGSYATGSWMDPLWPLAYALVGLAAVWQMSAARTASVTGMPVSGEAGPPPPPARGTSKGRLLAEQIRTGMPYAIAPVAIFLILWAQSHEGEPAYLHTTGPMIAGILLLALVLARQSVTLLEKNKLEGTLTELSHDLENRVEQRTKELSLLNQVAMTMSQCGSSKQVIENGLRLAREALGCDAVGLSLQVPGARRRFFGGPGLKKSARAQLVGAAHRVLTADEPDQGEKFVDTPVVLDKVAVVPLVSRQASIGGLCMAPWGDDLVGASGDNGQGATADRDHSESQLELASAVASQIAVAFENARRFEDAHYLAHRDPVTGLLNHRGMNERLEQELARCARIGSKFSVVMMDMDNFKLFNDTYGHAVGDEVLVTVSKVLGKAVRKYDTVARYGGDEFVALLPDTTTDGALVLVKRLRATINDRAFYLEKKTLNRVPIVLSYGIATYPNQGSRVAEVMSAADANLYKSKSKGGDWITAPSPQVGHRTNTKLGVFNVLDGLVTTVDNKDHYTRQHSDDVCGHALALATKMGLSGDHQRALRTAAILHDVGKIGVPDSVLRKPGSLTDEEFEVIKQHVVLSKLIIKEVPDLDEVLAAVATHHERYDGVGYPDGLKGDQIPLLGRILAVTDAYSAMTTDRPYRRALTTNEAVAELKRVAGRQLDPELVPLFVEVIEEEQTNLATVKLTVA